MSNTYNIPSFLQNSASLQGKTHVHKYRFPSTLKTIFYIFCIFSSFHLSRLIYDKVSMLLSFVEKYQVKILRLEKKIDKLETQLELSGNELRRLKEDRKNHTWEMERTLLRDYISKSDHETLMQHFREFIRSNIKELKGILSKQQKNNQSLQNHIVNMFQSFLKMQGDQNQSLHSIMLSTSRFNNRRQLNVDSENILPQNSLKNSPSLHKSNAGVVSPNDASEENRKVDDKWNDSETSSTTSRDSSESSSYGEKRYTSNGEKHLNEEKKYIQDILNSDKVDDDFDDIFKQHMDEIQSGTTPLSAYDPVSFDATRSTEGLKNISGGVLIHEDGIKDQKHNPESNNEPEGVVYESVSYISEDISTQQLTQTFKDSIMKDDKMKNSKLMSFFDKIAIDPNSLEESLQLTVNHNPVDLESEELQQNFSQSNAQGHMLDQITNPTSPPKQLTNNSFTSMNSWEMDEEAKGKLAKLFEERKQTTRDSFTNDKLDPSILELDKEFDTYNFQDDSLFRSRLQSYKESGEFESILQKMGNDEELALLKVKGNYYSYSINPKFDINNYLERRNTPSNGPLKLTIDSKLDSSIQKSENEKDKSIVQLDQTEKKADVTEISKVGSTTHDIQDDISEANPISTKRPNTPRLKPWERKKKIEQKSNMSE